jgi:hypothetical protein
MYMDSWMEMSDGTLTKLEIKIIFFIIAKWIILR